MNEILIRGLSTTVIGMLIVFITLGILSYVISLLKGIKRERTGERRAGRGACGI